MKPLSDAVDFAKQQLEVYTFAKKHQLRVAMSYGMLCTPAGGPGPVFSTYMTIAGTSRTQI
jgi:hypothetical protein